MLRLWRMLAARCAGHLVLDVALGESAVERCRAIIDGEIRDPFACSAVAYEITMAVATLIGSVAADAEPGGLGAAREFARAHLAEAIGVEDLAAAAGMSKAHFSHRFRAATGHSPGAWLIEQRLAHGAELLTTTDEPLAVIAERSGFADVNYFIKAFRRCYGVTPGTYRHLQEGPVLRVASDTGH